MFFPLGHIPRYDDPAETQWGRVTFDTARCTGCNMCVRACPSKVLVLDGKQARMVEAEAPQCIACADCVAVCGDQVISLARSYAFSGAYLTLDRGELLPPRL
jgi:2-oxoglutarate ferredoxin oxidoreductase subunit delta